MTYALRTLILLLVFMSGAVAGRFSASVADKDRTFRERISPKEFAGVDRQQMIGALKGDHAAASRILDFLDKECAKGTDAQILSCLDESEKWAFIDAENGGLDGMSRIAGHYQKDDSCFSQARALYWFNLANRNHLFDSSIEGIEKALSKC